MSSAAASAVVTITMLTVETNSEFDLLHRVRVRVLFRDHGREVAEVIAKADVHRVRVLFRDHGDEVAGVCANAEAVHDSAQEDVPKRLRDELAEMIRLHFGAVSEKLAAHFDADALRDALLRPSPASSAERPDLHE